MSPSRAPRHADGYILSVNEPRRKVMLEAARERRMFAVAVVELTHPRSHGRRYQTRSEKPCV
jgi:hypothetical protein